jgi:deazaflavin-dependent oxidoreductase (nitroreductase family)
MEKVIMPEQNIRPQSQTSIRLPYPTGLLRFAFRLPILLYRLHLGWLLGNRFLLLEHRGRKSGLLRQVVIEVVDQDKQVGSYFVVAAWGEKSDWYKNILAQSQVNIVVGSKHFPAIARTIPPEEAVQHLTAYAKSHPIAFRELGSILIGHSSHEPAELVQSFVNSVPLVEFAPIQ